jgi:hypothetical protein
VADLRTAPAAGRRRALPTGSDEEDVPDLPDFDDPKD